MNDTVSRETGSVELSIPVDPDLLHQLSLRAEAEGKTPSALCTDLVHQCLQAVRIQQQDVVRAGIQRDIFLSNLSQLLLAGDAIEGISGLLMENTEDADPECPLDERYKARLLGGLQVMGAYLGRVGESMETAFSHVYTTAVPPGGAA